MENFTASPQGEEAALLEFENQNTGEVFWVPKDCVLSDKQDTKRIESKYLIAQDENAHECPGGDIAMSRRGHYRPMWSRHDMDFKSLLLQKDLTKLQHDVMVAVELEMRYGNKVTCDVAVLAARVKATESKVSRALVELEKKDLLTRLGPGWLMVNPDLMLAGESAWRGMLRREYATARAVMLEKRRERAARREAKKAAAPVLRLVEAA